MVAEPEVLAASVESTSERKVCPELALGRGGSVGPSTDPTEGKAPAGNPAGVSTPGLQAWLGGTHLFRL